MLLSAWFTSGHMIEPVLVMHVSEELKEVGSFFNVPSTSSWCHLRGICQHEFGVLASSC